MKIAIDPKLTNTKTNHTERISSTNNEKENWIKKSEKKMKNNQFYFKIYILDSRKKQR